MKILITGAGGYIGGMLTDIFLNDPQVEKVVALDIKEKNSLMPPELQNHKKLVWITHNLGDNGWEEKVLGEGHMDAVIHCAYVIRQGYGKKRAWQIRSNIRAAEKVFAFAFDNNIKKLIHYSTVASYGALKSNSLDHWFVESDPFRDDGYLYATDKRIIEEKLHAMYAARQMHRAAPKIYVIRPCAISGPRGQHTFKRFGLLRMVKEGVLPIIPITGNASARQFVHEDDIADITVMLARDAKEDGDIETFNIAPPCYFLLKDMARIIGKTPVRVPKFIGKIAFAALWHISRGKIPTVPEGIQSYTYPIIVDGSKVTKRLGFSYHYNCMDALQASRGRYERAVHETQ